LRPTRQSPRIVHQHNLETLQHKHHGPQPPRPKAQPITRSAFHQPPLTTISLGPNTMTFSTHSLYALQISTS
jgi:hypothetical protein